MTNFLKVTGLASAALVAGTMMAAAAPISTLIDFTDDTVGLTGSFNGNNWEVTGFPDVPNQTTAFGPGNIGVLEGDYDGIGITSDEIAFPREYVTITFDKNVRLTASYFLDLFISSDGTSKEVANLSLGTGIAMPEDASLEATDQLGQGGLVRGYGELEGLSLIGREFSFWASETNDFFGDPDFALAAVRVEVVPVPASMLLLGTALGGLGLARRRKRKS